MRITRFKEAPPSSATMKDDVDGFILLTEDHSIAMLFDGRKSALNTDGLTLPRRGAVPQLRDERVAKDIRAKEEMSDEELLNVPAME